MNLNLFMLNDYLACFLISLADPVDDLEEEEEPEDEDEELESESESELELEDDEEDELDESDDVEWAELDLDRDLVVLGTDTLGVVFSSFLTTDASCFFTGVSSSVSSL
jgi:hypothetical protein